MRKVININVNIGNKEVMNEDLYRDQIINAIDCLQAGTSKKAKAILVELLDDVEKVLEGKEI